MTLLQLLLDVSHSLFREEGEIVRIWEIYAFFEQHLVGSEVKRRPLGALVFREPLCQHIDTLQTEQHVFAANIFEFGLLFKIGDLIVYL